SVTYLYGNVTSKCFRRGAFTRLTVEHCYGTLFTARSAGSGNRRAHATIMPNLLKKISPWAALFAIGCTSAPHSQPTHEVYVQRFENGFLQTVETEAWSIWTHNDPHGNRWPTG